MEVILLEKIRSLGALGDVVAVKSGFARNYLVPKGKAVYASKANRARFEERRAELEKVASEKHKQATERRAAIDAIGVITIPAKAGEEGKLFGSIGVRDICDALNQAGANVEKKEVILSEGTLRNVGEYEIQIELDSDVTTTVKVAVASEAAGS